MKPKYTLAILLVFTMGTLLAVTQQRKRDVKIKTTAVAGPVYMLEGQGGNIGVSAGEDGVLIVDDQFDYLAKKIQAAVDALGKGRIKYVLNTHHHGDHTGGNKIFGKNSLILAHDNVRKRLAEGNGNGSPSPESLPVITYKKGISLHFNGEEIRVIHLPRGHTDGDSIVHFTGSNVVHMGDHFFSGRFPFIDLEGGGDVEGFLKNIDTALELLPADIKIIPGHGPLSTMEDLRTFRSMLQETTGIVRKQVKEGKTLEEIQQAGLPSKWDSWGESFINTKRWIEIMQKSFTRGS